MTPQNEAAQGSVGIGDDNILIAGRAIFQHKPLPDSNVDECRRVAGCRIRLSFRRCRCPRGCGGRGQRGHNVCAALRTGGAEQEAQGKVARQGCRKEGGINQAAGGVCPSNPPLSGSEVPGFPLPPSMRTRTRRGNRRMPRDRARQSWGRSEYFLPHSSAVTQRLPSPPRACGLFPAATWHATLA